MDEESKKQVDEALGLWKALEGQKVTVDGEELIVKFEFGSEIVTGPTFLETLDKAEAKANAGKIENVFYGSNETFFAPSGIKINKGQEYEAGITYGGNLIAMPLYDLGGENKTHANVPHAVAHEIGHTLGLEDNTGDRGSMDYDTYKNGPNSKDIERIIKYAKEGNYQQGEAKTRMVDNTKAKTDEK